MIIRDTSRTEFEIPYANVNWMDAAGRFSLYSIFGVYVDARGYVRSTRDSRRLLYYPILREFSHPARIGDVIYES